MKIKFFPFALILLPFYFVLFLFANNISALQPVDWIRPALFSFLLLFAIFGILNLVIRNVSKAALITIILWTAFSLYGHLYGALQTQQGILNQLGRHSFLGPLYSIVVVAVILMVLRSKMDFRRIHNAFSVILAGLIMFLLFNITNFYWQTSKLLPLDPNTGGQKKQAIPLPDLQTKPDIYYIVLDSYSREDVIRQEVKLDIAPFLDQLRQKGFYIGNHSVSNYSFTEVSLTSSLNMDFIQNLDPRFTATNPDNYLLDDYLLHNQVRTTLEDIGYKTIAFDSGYSFTEMIDAGEYLSPAKPSLFDANVQPFESLWLRTTALRALFDIHIPWISNLSFSHSDHVARQSYILDELPRLAQQPGAKFVFAHVLIPHVPLVFRADGSITKDDRYFGGDFSQPVGEDYMRDGYLNQVEYINNRILTIIDEIIQASPQPPIIILQGDHGFLYFDHFPILNAYYFPGKEKPGLYPTITPINSFRLLFNNYFGANLPLLPDISFESTYAFPYDFKQVTNDNSDQ